MAFTTLIDPEALHARLDDPDWRVFDCRFDLADPDAGRRDWARGHVPGALYAHLEADLSGAPAATSGRHPLPDAAALADWLGQNGVDATVQVVCYDADSGAFAARLWWLLRWLGHDRAAVLDGGLAAWHAAGFPVVASPPARPEPRRFHAHRRDRETWIDAAGIEATPALVVVDARAPERFRGEREPIDPVAGHVPGALNRPFTRNLGADGRWLDPETLRAEWRRLAGDAPAARVVHMCGSGVTAAHNALAMEYAGLTGSRLYPGSWSEWIRDPARPIERGPGTAANSR